MKTFKLKVTKEYYYYGSPRAYARVKVDSQYFNGTLEYNGNQGYELPQLKPKTSKNNGYYWTLRGFMRDLYSNKSLIESTWRSLKEGESKVITLTY